MTNEDNKHATMDGQNEGIAERLKFDELKQLVQSLLGVRTEVKVTESRLRDGRPTLEIETGNLVDHFAPFGRFLWKEIHLCACSCSIEETPNGQFVGLILGWKYEHHDYGRNEANFATLRFNGPEQAGHWVAQRVDGLKAQFWK